MKFVDLVEITEKIESKLENLSDTKLDLLETILKEGAEFEFDIEHHLDYLVKFVETQTDENAKIIAETVDGGEVLNILLETIRKHTNDMDAFIAEANKKVGEIDVETNDVELNEDETTAVTLLSIVTNTLTEMLGEETVENLPAEMIFDIVEEAKYLDLPDDITEMDIVSLVEEISNKLKEAILEGKIDLDTDDYEGETLAEFLDKYIDIDDLLEEMSKINEEFLAGANDEVDVNLLRKAKAATVLVEAKMKRCKPGDTKCRSEKARAAKEYFAKNELPGGGNIKEIDIKNLTGKLEKYVNKAKKAARKAGKELSNDYVQYVLVPGIIKRMRVKNKRLKAKDMMKKRGMK